MRKSHKILIAVAVIVALFLIYSYFVGLQVRKDQAALDAQEPTVTLLAPTISATGEQVLKPGRYEVRWKATNPNKTTGLVVALKKGLSTENLVESEPMPTSLGRYSLDIPPVPDATEKYRIWIYTNTDAMDRSNPFSISN